MLALHCLLFFAGASLLCWHAIPSAWLGALAVLLFGLFPPVLGLLSTVWKDVALGVSLLLGFGLLLRADLRKSKAAFIGSIACMFYALAVRHNSMLAVLPLAIFAGVVFAMLYLSNPTRRTGILYGLLIFGSLLIGVTLSNRSLTGGRTTYHYQGFVMHDLVAISIAKSRLYLPSYTYWNAEAPSIDDLKRIYDPANIVFLFGGVPSARPLKFTDDPKEVAVLRKAWLAALLQAPGAYLNHRWIMFKVQLGLGQRAVCYPYQEGIETNSLKVVPRESRLNQWVMERLDPLRDSFMFRGWFYVAATLIMVCFFPLLSREQRSPAMALAASSLLYELAFFFVSPTCDFRFNWWTVVATVALLIYLAAPLAKRFKTSASASTSPNV